MKRALFVVIAFLSGACLGLFGFAVGREVVWAFQSEPPGVLISRILTRIGSLAWVDSGLIAGLIAIGAAAVGFIAVQAQITAAKAALATQLEHADQLETDRRLAKHEAALAVLPVSLSRLIETSQERAASIRLCIELCQAHWLPHGQELPDFAAVPPELVNDLKALVEYSTSTDRATYRRLIVAMQVQTARLTSLAKYDLTPEFSISRGNLIVYMLGEAEIYARSAQLYAAARLNRVNGFANITKGQVGSGLFSIGIYDNLRDEIIATYGLDTDDDYPTAWLGEDGTDANEAPTVTDVEV